MEQGGCFGVTVTEAVITQSEWDPGSCIES